MFKKLWQWSLIVTILYIVGFFVWVGLYQIGIGVDLADKYHIPLGFGFIFSVMWCLFGGLAEATKLQ